MRGGRLPDEGITGFGAGGDKGERAGESGKAMRDEENLWRWITLKTNRYE